MIKIIPYLLLCTLLASCASTSKPIIGLVNAYTPAPSDLSERVMKYLSSRSDVGDKIENVTLTSPKPFILFNNNGHLVCASSTAGENLFYYPGPYSIMVTENGVFDAGGGDYLCSMNSVSIQDSSEFEPILKPPPDYPVSFFEEKKSGYVITEYTVIEDGSVTDIHIFDTDVSDVFTEKALESVENYTYQPRIIDGIPQKVYGVRTRINFVRDEKKQE